MYNFDAREKVRKDEEEAAAAEAATHERALAGERAYRHGVLLERAAKRRRGDGEEGAGAAAGALEATAQPAQPADGALAHVNLFQDIEARRQRLRRSARTRPRTNALGLHFAALTRAALPH